jgi:hypothetical protein
MLRLSKRRILPVCTTTDVQLIVERAIRWNPIFDRSSRVKCNANGKWLYLHFNKNLRNLNIDGMIKCNGNGKWLYIWMLLLMF